MRCRLGAFSLIVVAAATLPAVAQMPPNPPAQPEAGPAPGRNISATGRTMPPASPIGVRPSLAEEMAKAQKAADARNKAWDTKMRKTMSSICSGC